MVIKCNLFKLENILTIYLQQSSCQLLSLIWEKKNVNGYGVKKRIEREKWKNVKKNISIKIQQHLSN